MKNLRTTKLSTAPVKLTDALKKKLWPYADDEIEIRPDATWADVEKVLDVLGNGDQFERIRDEALRLHGMPEDVVGTSTVDDHDAAMAEMRKVIADRNAKMAAKFDKAKLVDIK